MFRTTTLAAFLVTVAVIVPAGWHALRADIQTDGKRLRPLQTSFTVDGVRVTLDVNRSVVMTGDTVKATLVAYSDTPKQVTVDLTALHTSNYEGERVETPWIPIDHEVIKLTARPDGGPAFDTSIKLGSPVAEPAREDSFKIYVTEHGRKPVRREGEDMIDYATGVSEGYAAATAIEGWSGNNLGIAIAPEGTPSSNAPFVVAVRVKNTSGQKLARHPMIYLTTEAALSGTEDPDGKVAAVEIEDAAPADGASDEDVDMARGATTVKRFKVTVHQPGLRKLTFLASASEYEDQPGPLNAGAKDARTFTLSETAPAMAAR